MGRRMTPDTPDQHGRAWAITIPAPFWLTANKDLHHQQRSRIVRQWRQATVNACTRAGLPTGVTPVALSGIAYYLGTHRPVRDRLNLAPTFKAITDGLTPRQVKQRQGRLVVSEGYGLLPDDSDGHVLDTKWEVERLTPIGRFGLPGVVGVVVLTVTEVTADALRS